MPLVDTGKTAPAFTLRDSDGEKHALKDYRGHHVVLYFYPKDDTSGCTKEACQFRDAHSDFDKLGAVILGVSPDDEKSHRKFSDKHELNFTLLADPKDSDGTPAICEKYGVWQEKSMYGRKYMGVARTTYLIDPKGKVVHRWDKVKVPEHETGVLAMIKEG